MIRAAVVTVSDKGSHGERDDLSGPTVVSLLKSQAIEVACTVVVPDDPDRIKAALIDCADRQRLDLIITTGGTGVSPRDVTPEATREILEKEIPGMAEAMRLAGIAKTPHAMISRALAGVRGETLIINLPGSPKGVRENLAAVLPAIPHTIEKLRGGDADCSS